MRKYDDAPITSKNNRIFGGNGINDRKNEIISSCIIFRYYSIIFSVRIE